MKSGMEVNHTDQQVTFKSSVFHMSAASVMFFLKNKYRGINMGGLYELLAQKLVQSRKFGSSSINFSLVNIYSQHTGFSHGASLPPPEEVRPAYGHLVFTFSLDVYDAVQDLQISVKNKRSNAVSQYGDTQSPTAFTSVGLTSREVSQLGIPPLYGENLAYLYNIIGVMTKSLARNQRYFVQDETYGDFYPDTLKALHDKYGQAPLYKIITKVPYPYWVFSSLVWKYAPNLLTRKHITPHVALYYFLYLHKATRFVPGDQIETLVGNRLVESGSILGHLADSLLQLAQRINTPGYSRETSLDLLAPAVAYSLVTSGGSRIDSSFVTDATLRAFLEDSATYMSDALSDLDVDVGDLLLPPEAVALKMFYSDKSYTARLIDELDFSRMDLR